MAGTDDGGTTAGALSQIKKPLSMIRFDVIRMLVEFYGRFNNPLLAGILTFAIILQIAGYAVEFYTEPRMLSGFLMVFAILFATFSVFGYTLVFAFKAFLKLDRKYGLTTS